MSMMASRPGKNRLINRGGAGRALLLITLGAAIGLIGCARGEPPPASVPARPDEGAAARPGLLISINGEPFAPDKKNYEGGYRVEIEGAFPDTPTDPSTHAYIVVKPDNEDFYYVQPRTARTSGGRWIGQAFVGQPEAGIGGEFAIFAVFTSQSYKEGERMGRPPEGVRSATIRFVRTRN